jgi:hypothetical protein
MQEACSDQNCGVGVCLRGRIVKEAKLGKSSGLLYSITKTAHVKNLQPRFSATCLLIYRFALFNLLDWRNRRESIVALREVQGHTRLRKEQATSLKGSNVSHFKYEVGLRWSMV